MAATEQRLSTTVLVIGTGGAGLRASVELAEAGVDVLAVGKRPKDDAHTSLAAGGINAALATMDPEDSWQQHAADTLTESYLLGDPRTTEIVTRGAARGIDDLEREYPRELLARCLLYHYGGAAEGAVLAARGHRVARPGEVVILREPSSPGDESAARPA